MTSVAQALEAPPFTSLVNDTAALLSDAARERLNRRLIEFQAERGSELALLTLDSLQRRDPAKFAEETVAAWQLGEESGNSGVLVLVAKQDQQIHIAVSRGLEHRISNTDLEQILDDIVIPELRAGRFDLGVEGCFNALITRAGGKGDADHVQRLIAQKIAAGEKKHSTGESSLKRPFNFALTSLFLLWIVAGSWRKYRQSRRQDQSSGSTGAASPSSFSRSSSSSSSSSGGGGSFGGGGASGSW